MIWPLLLGTEGNKLFQGALTEETGLGTRQGGQAGLTLVHSEQRCKSALVPDSDEQSPGQHDEDDRKDVPSLRHLQGWLCPQLLIT